MRRWKASLLGLLVAVAAVGQEGSRPTGPTPLANPSVRRIGHQLKCLCGCKADVTGCDMLQCHYADPKRRQIADMVQKGYSDDQVIQSIAQQEGLTAVLKPPSNGFYMVGWVMPFLGLSAGLALLYAFLQRGRRPVPVPLPSTGNAKVVPDPLDRYRDRIDEELSKLD